MSTQWMGILNITPDSFSDGAQFLSPSDAITQAKKLIHDGATIIDIGAESTRPGATPLTATQEWERLRHILPRLSSLRTHATLSIDSYHLETIRKSLLYGVEIVNYVSSELQDDFLTLLANYPTVRIVLMHNLGIPADKSVTLDDRCNVVDEINQWFTQKIADISPHIHPSRLILDPGIGFGKNARQSNYIIAHAEQFKVHGRPLLFGHSRKSFLPLSKKATIEEKDIATATISDYLISKHIDILRLHSVAGLSQQLSNS